MAGSNPLGAFTGAQAATDAQKAALGSLIAAQGSEGVKSYKADQAVAQEMAKAGQASVPAANPGIGQPNMASAVGPGELTQQLAARAAEPGNTYGATFAAAAQDFGKYSGMLGRANANYMDAVKSATPIVQSQTQAQIAQINADLAERRRARQEEADNAATDRAWQMWQRKNQLEDRAYELSQRAGKDANGNPIEPQSLTAKDAGSRLGYNDKEVGALTNSKAYTQLLLQARQAFATYGNELDMDQLAGILNDHLNTLRGDPASGVADHDYPQVMSLVLAQMRPRLRNAAQSHSADVGYGVFGRTAPGAAPPPPTRAQQAVNDFFANAPKPDKGKSGKGGKSESNPLKGYGSINVQSVRNFPDDMLTEAYNASRSGTSDRILLRAEMQRRRLL